MAVTRPNQVRALNTTYIPVARGFVYLTTVPTRCWRAAQSRPGTAAAQLVAANHRGLKSPSVKTGSPHGYSVLTWG